MCVAWWAFAQYHRERAAHQATIRALVQAVDIKDGYTRGHSERVGQASMMIARELGMDDERVETLRFAGILHDVGKLGVPTRLLRKDGPLTLEERRVIELHPSTGTRWCAASASWGRRGPPSSITTNGWTAAATPTGWSATGSRSRPGWWPSPTPSTR